MDEIDNQRAVVSQEFALRIDAIDTDGDPLAYSVSAELMGLTTRSRFQSDAKGATFYWTPLVSDLGDHVFTITATDGLAGAARKFRVDVASGEGGTAPVFVQPLGTGSTLDLTQAACIEVPIVVSDPDTPGVTLGQEEPLIQGAELVQAAELSGTWSFCPTREQVAASDRYTLRLSADDFENPKTTKDYLVVLRGGDGSDCPGSAPVINHDDDDWDSIADVRIEATISDDVGLKFEPLLYFSTKKPSDPPDIAQMTQVTMSLTTGSMRNGDWVGSIPNPVAADSTGASAKLWYLITATDNDDEEGPCDHTSQAPSKTVFEIEVTNTGSGGGAGEVCDPCSADAQCGGNQDLCVNFSGGYHCFEDCEVDNDCPDETYCSFSTFTSIDGKEGRQCLPVDLTCDMDSGSSCNDDSYEDNDYSWQAEYLFEGTHSLTSCPDGSGGDDEDWFEFDVFSNSTVDVILDGGSATDLDVILLDEGGAVLDRGDSVSSFEVVSACVAPGTYRLHVLAYGSAENDYDLDLNIYSSSCGDTCVDDSNEPDDSISTSRYADIDTGPYNSYYQQICSDDDDWYEVYLFDGEVVYATLDFVQITADQDLDLLFFGSDGTNYSVCDEFNPDDCDPLNGQSGSSDESMAWSINVEDYYYVVVHGWDGSENEYDICIGLTETECP